MHGVFTLSPLSLLTDHSLETQYLYVRRELKSQKVKPYPPRLYITGTSKIPILVATTLYTTSPPISASPPMRASGEILSRVWRIRANLRISCPRRGSNV